MGLTLGRRLFGGHRRTQDKNRGTGDTRSPINEYPVWPAQGQEVRSPAAWAITSAAVLGVILPIFNIMW